MLRYCIFAIDSTADTQRSKFTKEPPPEFWRADEIATEPAVKLAAEF
jgi:hypothetical protein